jgi:hypothetical protein
MEDIYLKSGTKARLIEKVNEKYLVEVYYEFYDWEGGPYQDLSGSQIVVNEIFKEAPIEVKSKEYLDLISKYESKVELLKNIESDIYKARSEQQKIKKDNDDLRKWRVDLSKFKKAKNLVFFEKNSLKLVTTNPSDYKESGYRLKFSINVYDGQVNEYGCDLDWESRTGYGTEKIDYDFGYLIDPTEQEIKDFVSKRFKKHQENPEEIKGYAVRYINQVPERYQSEEIKQYILKNSIEQKSNNLKNMEEKLEKDKESIKKLKQEIRDLSK